jgi:Holliday junction resolvasome RuvABC endonuclease subunit
MKIMGLDLAIGTTGLCLPDGSTMRIKPKGKGDDRLNEIRDHIRLAARTSWTDLVVLEDVPSNMKGAAGKVIPMLHGSVRSMLADDGLPYVEISPSTLKKYATGQGNCDKTAMAMWAYKRAHAEFADDNECDAWWLHVAGMERAEQPLFILPLPQRQALKVADWSPLAVAATRLRARQKAAQGVPVVRLADVLADPFE